MNADEQIRGVMDILKHARAVNVSGKPFTLARDDLDQYPDYEPLLEKLAIELDAIYISRYPSMDDVEHAINVGFMPDKQLTPLISYEILPTTKFDEVYLELFGKAAVVLSPGSYNTRTGILTLNEYKSIAIAGHGNVYRPEPGANGKKRKYFNCYAMDKLFENRKTMLHGVEFQHLVDINKNLQLNKDQLKSVYNLETAIRNKLRTVNVSEKLILFEDGRIKINRQYLLKT